VVADPAQAHGLLDLLDTGVVRLDGTGRIVLMNNAAEQCLLVSRDRARGRYIGEVADIPQELRAAVHQLPEGDHSVRLHELNIANRPYDCTIQRTGSQDVLLEFHNLEWERLRLRLQQRELQTGMLEFLSRNLGHEVRNPLGGIRGAAQMLADELESGDLATLAKLIMRESDRIDELIQRFGQPELHRQETHVYPLLDEALDVLMLEFGDKVEVIRDYDPSIPALQADATAIRQVLLNLLQNACQAGATEIRIRTRVEHGHALLQAGPGSVIRLDFIDNGQGVPEALRSLLFLPLVTGRRGGTGLGLALSQQIASAHGGLLTFQPMERGSRFSLLLPFTHDAPEGEPGGEH
jgi:two-component system, NtrC family, nitrogen regulation sensor histidine kinase GlnL